LKRSAKITAKTLLDLFYYMVGLIIRRVEGA